MEKRSITKGGAAPDDQGFDGVTLASMLFFAAMSALLAFLVHILYGIA